jgi:hypothetical protein
MGDMADYCNECIFDNEEALGDYYAGHMTHGEAYDRGIIDEFGFVGNPGLGPISKTCKFCQQQGLSWGKINGNWRLVDNGKLHICPVNPLVEY